eukprot:5675673-Alexandrium_andersonii.AAC.1
MSLATKRLRTLGFVASPLWWPTHLPPIGFLPVRARHSVTGRASHACRDCTKRISSARAASTSSGARAAP